MSEVWLVPVFVLKGLKETFAYTRHSVYVLISSDFYLSTIYECCTIKYERVIIIIIFVILTALLWYVTTCSLLKIYRPFRRTFCFHTEEGGRRFVWYANKFVAEFIIFSKNMCCDCTKSVSMHSKKCLSPLCNLKTYFCILSCFESVRVCVFRLFASARNNKGATHSDFVYEIGTVLFSLRVFSSFCIVLVYMRSQ